MLKIVYILYIIITLMTLLISINSNIIVESRILILTATYIIGMIAGMFQGFIALLEITKKEDK